MKHFWMVGLMLASSAFAQQTQNLDQESQGTSRRGALHQQSAEAAQDASSDDGAFAAVLASPGNVDLNEKFARAQIKKGDLRGAASTLERVLILAPDRDRTRLLYAAILFRLDDAAEAQRELETVLSRPVPADVAAEAGKFLKLAKGRRRTTHFDARVSFGGGWDDDRNAASKSGDVLFAGTPIPLTSDSLAQKDTNIQFSGSLGASADVGGAGGHSLFARVGYYRGEQSKVSLMDLQAYTGRAGGVYHTLWADLTPSVGFEHVLLSQSTYLRSSSEGLRATHRLSKTTAIWAEFSREDQRFLDTPRIASGADRTGDQYDTTAGVGWFATPLDKLSLTVGHRRKFAQADFDAYRREWATAEYLRLLGHGMFAIASVTGQFDRYPRPELLIADVNRQDNALDASLLFGVPLNVIHHALEGFSATLSFDRFQQKSNITNYEYANDKITGLIAYQWGLNMTLGRSALAWLLAATAAAAPSPAVSPIMIGVAGAVRGGVRGYPLGDAAGQIVSTGRPVYTGERIVTAPDARLQILLRDQTTFTLGPNADMVLDEYVFNESTGEGQVAARILKGAFRFITGKIAAKRPDHMKVRTPVGTIGVRGTMVAGAVSASEATVVLMGPGRDNSGRERPGEITVGNGRGTVDIDRPGFGTTIRAGEAPLTPFLISPAKLDALLGGVTSPPTQHVLPGGGGRPGEGAIRSAADASGQATASGMVVTTLMENGMSVSTFVDPSQLAAAAAPSPASWADVQSIPSGTAIYSGGGTFSGAAGSGSLEFVLNIDFGAQTIGGQTSTAGTSVIVTQTTSGSIPSAASLVGATSFAGLTGPATLNLTGTSIPVQSASVSFLNAGGVPAQMAQLNAVLWSGAGPTSTGQATGSR